MELQNTYVHVKRDNYLKLFNGHMGGRSTAVSMIADIGIFSLLLKSISYQ